MKRNSATTNLFNKRFYYSQKLRPQDKNSTNELGGMYATCLFVAEINKCYKTRFLGFCAILLLNVVLGTDIS